MYVCLSLQLYWHTDLCIVPYSWPWDIGLVWQSSRNTWNGRTSSSRAERKFNPNVASFQRRKRCFQGHLRVHSMSRVFSSTNCICLAACIRNAGSLHDKNPTGRLSSLTNENLAVVRLRLTDLPRKPINHSVTGRDWVTVSLLRCAKFLKLAS
jgi:hypothetical protein